MQNGGAPAGGLLASAVRASGRAAAKSGRGGKASGAGGGGDKEPRAIVTGMEGLGHVFQEGGVYPAYSPGGVQPMHSGAAGGGGAGLGAGRGWLARGACSCSACRVDPAGWHSCPVAHHLLGGQLDTRQRWIYEAAPCPPPPPFLLLL